MLLRIHRFNFIIILMLAWDVKYCFWWNKMKKHSIKWYSDKYAQFNRLHFYPTLQWQTKKNRAFQIIVHNSIPSSVNVSLDTNYNKFATQVRWRSNSISSVYQLHMASRSSFKNWRKPICDFVFLYKKNCASNSVCDIINNVSSRTT
jgi:hypothetical protein